MIDFLRSIFESVRHFFTGIYDYLSTTIYEALVYLGAALTKFIIIGYFEMKLAALDFAWDVVKPILQGLNIGQQLSYYLGLLPSDVSYNLAALNIPQSLILILTAFVTKIVLRVLPFGG